MGRALQSLHMVICVTLKMGPFQLFTAFFAILFTDRYNHYLKISKLSSKLSFQLRLSRDSGIAEQLMLTGPCFPATHRVLSNAPLHLALIRKQGAENTLICASILCHGRISWNSLLRILLWIQLLIVFYMETSELGWNCSYFVLYGGSRLNCTLSWFSWVGVLKAFLSCTRVLAGAFHSALEIV